MDFCRLYMQNTNISIKISQLEWQLQQDIKSGSASPQRILMIQQNIDSLKKYNNNKSRPHRLKFYLSKGKKLITNFVD